MLARFLKTLLVGCLCCAACRASPSADPGQQGVTPAANAPPLGRVLARAREALLAVTGDAAPAPGEGRLRPYPRGRWRLLSPAALDRVLLRVSHILIRHEGVPVLQSYFTQAPASSEPPAPRSRRAALERARDIARQAREEGLSFGELARRHSEDRATRDWGGSLGPVLASSFRPWPEVLDALAALKPGEVSEVVETEFGFHLFTWRAAPPEATFSGSHLVIGHDDASWLGELLWRWPVPRRSRQEALELVTEIYEQALAAPERFAELVARHSEHRDAALGGDFGAWSTRQDGPYPRQREQLEALPVNGIARPMETIFGFEIVQRTPDRPREPYAVSLLQLPFDPRQRDAAHPSSKPAVHRRAQELAGVLAAEPSRFGELTAAHCCREPVLWREGQSSSPMALATRELDIGQIASAPILFNYSYVIPRRLDPATLSALAPAFVFELPARVDVAELWRRTPSAALEQKSQAVAARAGALFGLAPGPLRALLELSRLPPELHGALPAPRRRALLASHLSALQAWLGPERFPRYLDLWQELYERESLR